MIHSPELREAIDRRARTRKRLAVTAAIALVIILSGSISWSVISRRQRETRKLLVREESARRDLNALAEALERFRMDVERYPTKQEGLMGLTRRPAALPADAPEREAVWFGPYLEHPPEVDPWGNDYVYNTNDGGRTFELLSNGPGGGETGSDSRFHVVSRSPVGATR